MLQLSESHTGTNMSTMKRETEPILRSSKKQEVANMSDALAEMRRSGSIHFMKSLPKTAIQAKKTEDSALLTLPAQFVQENGDKIEEWVILRSQLSRGKSSRPWLVRLGVAKPEKVSIGRGWHSFVADNRLQKDDSLIFLLKEDARSEFEVHMFRGPQGSPYFPDDGENSIIDEEEEDISNSAEESYKLSHFPSPGHHQVEHNKAFISNFRNGKAAAFPHSKHLEKHRTYPGFRKRLTASSIGRSESYIHSGQFEFPWSFVKTHGNQIQGSVKLQGIHEDSPTHVVTCRQIPEHSLRVYFARPEWSRFVKENGLKTGHELQFSLMAKSHFVVRKV